MSICNKYTAICHRISIALRHCNEINTTASLQPPQLIDILLRQCHHQISRPTILIGPMPSKSSPPLICVPLISTADVQFFHLIEADPDDNKFVDCAICGNAELIVTNDVHFNILKNIDFPIVDVKSIQEFTARRPSS